MVPHCNKLEAGFLGRHRQLDDATRIGVRAKRDDVDAVAHCHVIFVHSRETRRWRSRAGATERPLGTARRSSRSASAAQGSSTGSSISGTNGWPVISRLPRPWVMKLHPQRTMTTMRLAKPIK